jgi:hypothetical protein
MDTSATTRLKAAALAFIVIFLLFGIDVWKQTTAQFSPGLLSWVAVAALFHSVAFDAVLHRSRVGIYALWAAVVLGSACAFLLLSDRTAAIAATVAMLVYTGLLLWCLKKLLPNRPSAV